MHKHTKPSCKAQCDSCGAVRNIEDMRYTVHVAPLGIGLVGVWECATCPKQRKAAKVATAVAHKVARTPRTIEVRVEIDL